MPLGLPVEPEVYRMNNGCSALTQVGSHTSDWPFTTSCSHTSRLVSQATLVPVRLYTTTLWMDSQPPSISASSTAGFNGISRPPRNCPSAVSTAVAPASIMRSCRLLAEKPPNTTEWIAPMRAHACMHTTASIDIGM